MNRAPAQVSRSRRLFVLLAIWVASGLVAYSVLWTVGPDTRPGDTDYWHRLVVYFAIVVICLLGSRRIWDRR